MGRSGCYFRLFCSTFDVRRSMFDVRRSHSFFRREVLDVRRLDCGLWIVDWKTTIGQSAPVEADRPEVL